MANISRISFFLPSLFLHNRSSLFFYLTAQNIHLCPYLTLAHRNLDTLKSVIILRKIKRSYNILNTMKNILTVLVLTVKQEGKQCTPSVLQHHHYTKNLTITLSK